jgi:hypothetical protein
MKTWQEIAALWRADGRLDLRRRAERARDALPGKQGAYAEAVERLALAWEAAAAAFDLAWASDAPRVDLARHLERQRTFSERTFGPGGMGEAGGRERGLIDHIQRELREIAENPNDTEEWIDVAILAFDGAWRTGASSEQIAALLVAKQAKNERRRWPDWRTAEPGRAIEHVREPDETAVRVQTSEADALGLGIDLRHPARNAPEGGLDG